jgi:Spy/CpxP family protein refolding chaperone
MTGYLGAAGGPRDPATPGGYCLSRCLCGTCPQYDEQQRQVQQLREQEYRERIRKQHEREARRIRRAA